MEEKTEFQITEIKEEQSEKASKAKKTIKTIIQLGLGSSLFLGGTLIGLANANAIQDLPFPQNVFGLIGILTVVGTGGLLNWKVFDKIGESDKKQTENDLENSNERKR